MMPVIKSQLATVQAELGLSDPQSDRDYNSIKLTASVVWKHRLSASQELCLIGLQDTRSSKSKC